MRRVSVEYLGDAPDTGAAQMAAEEGRQGMQQVARRAFLIPGSPQQGIAVSAQKPGPDSALMVGFVTLSGPAYARPKGHAAEPLGRLYNLRSFSLESMHPFDARSSSAALTDWVKDGFRFLLPYYQLFEQAYGMVD